MSSRKFTVSAHESAQSLEELVAQKTSSELACARSLIEKGQVYVGGKRTTIPGTALRAGMLVQVFARDAESQDAPAVEILVQTKDFVAINKPAGLSSAPTRDTAQNCALSRVREQFPNASLLHRLDKETSGVLIFARSKAFQKQFAVQLEQRTLHKTYVALVWGKACNASQRVTLPIGPDQREHTKMGIGHGKEAITVVTHLAHGSVLGEDASVLQLQLLTGRTHQARVHCAAIGHPILGDDLYGTRTNSLPRMFLHAWKLQLKDGQTIQAKLPNEYYRLAPWIELALPSHGTAT